MLNKYLASGYPGGGQWTLGALSNLTPVDLSWLYQPFLAFLVRDERPVAVFAAGPR